MTTTPFTGQFEGLGHTISDLYINRPSENFVGLFGWMDSGSTVSNRGISGWQCQWFSCVGQLAGVNEGKINSSHTTGSVTGTYEVGGLVGYNFGTVENSDTTGTVIGLGDVGGLTGSNDGTISKSYTDR